MKKLLVLTLATVSIVGYSQQVVQPATTQQQDLIELQQARIAALDIQYKLQTNMTYLQYKQQRNNMIRQLVPAKTTNNVVVH